MPSSLDELIPALRERGMPSARNLLVTVFGDALNPHRTSVSVRSLATLLEPLEVSERLVRTSLSRLADDGLVAATRVGNRSYYGVHPNAARLFDRAEARIYGDPRRRWDGAWTLVIIDGNVGTADERAAVRRELGWLGLGSIAPNVMASPVVAPDEVCEAIAHVGLRDAIVVTRSETIVDPALVSDVDLARRAVPLDEVAARFDELDCWFSWIDHSPPRSPRDAFVARTLLIATYRRVLLADPALPDALLPGDWAGTRAYESVRRRWLSLHRTSERWLVDVCRTADGDLVSPAKPGQRFARR